MLRLYKGFIPVIHATKLIKNSQKFLVFFLTSQLNFVLLGCD